MEKVYLKKTLHYGLIKTPKGIKNNDLLSIPYILNLITSIKWVKIWEKLKTYWFIIILAKSYKLKLMFHL